MQPKGRPFEKGNQFGKGRPRGSRNKKNRAVQQLLEEYAEPVVRKTVLEGLKGDPGLLRTVFNHLISPRREPCVKLGKLPTGTVQELADSSEIVITAAGEGRITMGDAQAMCGLMQFRQRILETRDLAVRMQKFEERLKDEKQEK
jgi:hypothetical protein